MKLEDRLRLLRKAPAAGLARPDSDVAVEPSPSDGEQLPEPPTPRPQRASPWTRADPDALRRLETSLLGQSGDGLSLKERLERLVAATASRPPPRVRRGEPIEALQPGEVVHNAHGTFFLSETAVHLDAFHGDVPLGRLRTVVPDSVRVLAGEPGLAGFDLHRAAFLDTETTGLAGGSGTAAFLVGLGFVEEDSFVVRQYFMRDYNEERALLTSLAADLARFEHLVTFNGKMFDVPLLEARYRINREGFPLAGLAHLDLLHPARRLWKLRLESCRLQSLEKALIGVHRVGDVPGDEIPRIYFEFVRSRDARAVSRIFEHNRLDIVSLAVLGALACQWVAEGHAEDPRDVFSLARVLERAELFDRSEAEYQRALLGAEGEVRAAALLRLAERRKRAGSLEAAAALWEEAAEAGECAAFRELAILHERRRRDPEAALSLVERALAALDGRTQGCCRRTRIDFERRKARLEHKVARNRDRQRS
jgi:hypothetical protein